jgi:uncharacterized protein YicC (UPF0701 family)
MTGHGEAQRHEAGVRVAVEVRTVNNRFLKLLLRVSEGYGGLEPQIDAVIRNQLRRGAVTVNVRVDRESSPDDFRLNEVVLASYYRQLQELAQRAGVQQLPNHGRFPRPGRAGDDHQSARR